MSGILQLEDQLMVALLAATDAIFIPDRDPMSIDRHRVICERRQRYPTAGVPWGSEKVEPGLDDAGRKQVQRVLEDLVARGLADKFRPRGAKTLGAKLTDAGEARARALVGLPQFADSLSLLADIATYQTGDNVSDFMGHTWVPETLLAGVEWGDNERRHAFVAVEDKLLPALNRGLAAANCTVRGHCWYTLLPAGEKFLKRKPGNEVPAVLPAQDDGARHDYFYRLRLEFEALATATPQNDREIGDIPMPVHGRRLKPETVTPCPTAS